MNLYLPQQIWADNWGLLPFEGEAAGPHLKHNVARAEAYGACQVIHPTVLLQYTNVTDRQTDTQTGLIA